MFELSAETDLGRSRTALAAAQDCVQFQPNRSSARYSTYNHHLHQYQQAVQHQHQHHLSYSQSNSASAPNSLAYMQQSIYAPEYYASSELQAYSQGEQQLADQQNAADYHTRRAQDQISCYSQPAFYHHHNHNHHNHQQHQHQHLSNELNYYPSDSYCLQESSSATSSSAANYYAHLSNCSSQSNHTHKPQQQPQQLDSLYQQAASQREKQPTATSFAQATDNQSIGWPPRTAQTYDTDQMQRPKVAPLSCLRDHRADGPTTTRPATSANATESDCGTAARAKATPAETLRRSHSATTNSRASARASCLRKNQSDSNSDGRPGGRVVIARRKNATRSTTIIMKLWLRVRCRNPYPTRAEKSLLVRSSSMTNTQVSTWLANARRRLKKEGKFYEWMNHRPPQQQRRTTAEFIDEVKTNATAPGEPSRPSSACSGSSSTASSCASDASSASLDALVSAAATTITNAPEEVRAFVGSLIRAATRKRRPEQVGSSSVVSPSFSSSSSSASSASSSLGSTLNANSQAP